MIFIKFKQRDMGLDAISRNIAREMDLLPYSKIMQEGACLGFVHYVQTRLMQLISQNQYANMSEIIQIVVSELSSISHSSFSGLLQSRVVFESMLRQDVINLRQIQEVNTGEIMLSYSRIEYKFQTEKNGTTIQILFPFTAEFLKKYAHEILNKFIHYTFIDHSMARFRWVFLYSAVTDIKQVKKGFFDIISVGERLRVLLEGNADPRLCLACNMFIEADFDLTQKAHVIGVLCNRQSSDEYLIHIFDPNHGISQETVQSPNAVQIYLEKAFVIIKQLYQNANLQIIISNFYFMPA